MTRVIYRLAGNTEGILVRSPLVDGFVVCEEN